MTEEHDERYEIEQETESQLDELENVIPFHTDDLLEIILNSRDPMIESKLWERFPDEMDKLSKREVRERRRERRKKEVIKDA